MTGGISIGKPGASESAADRAERELQALVAALSARWPHDLGAALSSDLAITPAELEVVLATWDRLDYRDALETCDPAALQVRATIPVTTDACLALGAHVLDRLLAHATASLLRRVYRYRVENAARRPRVLQ